MKNNNKHTLLINCPDEKGLIFKVSGILFDENFNIINNREFVDVPKNRFYMRTRFEGDLNNKDDLINKLKEVLPKKAEIQIPENKKKEVVILATTEHHCLAELLIRNEHDELNFNIKAVVSNHENLKSLAQKFSIPFHFVPNGDIKREDHEREVLKVVEKYNPDFLVLAKYMQILSPNFVAVHKNKIINIHHSFLPAFIGANPYKQAHKRGVKIIGATAHFVNDRLDDGPIISQEVSQINHSYDVSNMKKAGHDIEKSTLVNALRLVFDDRVFLNGNKTIVFE